MDKRQTQPQRNSTSNTSSAPSTRSQRPNVKTADSRNSTMSSTSPSSALLQDLLREKKSSHQKRHQSRRIPSDNGYDDRPVQSSPIAPPNKDVYPDTERRTSIGAGGSGRPKEMGAREMDEYVSKINKQNFDLKLEIFHRRQQTAALEQRLERMQVLEDVNNELQDINEQLLQELEKRDQAVKEAVGIICELEEKIEDLELDAEAARPSTARPHSASGLVGDSRPAFASRSCDSTPKSPAIVDVPNRTSSRKATSSSHSRSRAGTPQPARRSRRTPSFLHESSTSPSALRSLYVGDDNKSRGAFSVFSKAGSILSRDDLPDPDSPRLSVLSESSFMSVYGSPKRLDFGKVHPSIGPPALDETLDGKLDGSTEQRNTPKYNSRVDQWIRSREAPTSTSHSSPKNSMDAESRPVFEEQRWKERRRATSKDHFEGFSTITSHLPPSNARKLGSPSFGGAMFGRDVLPPTPDTMSTANHETINRSSSSIIAEKNLNDNSSALPTLLPNLPTNRPRSADGVEARSPRAEVSRHGSDMGDMETMSDETQPGRSIRGKEDLRPSLFTSYSFMSGGSAKATRLLGPGSPSNPRLSCYGGDLMFNGEGIEDIISSNRSNMSNRSSTSRSKNRVSSKSPIPDRHQLEAIRAESPPLTPQGWLSASSETATSPKNDTGAVEHDVSPTTVASGRPASSPSPTPGEDPIADGPDVPRASTLRLRVPKPASPPTGKRLTLKARIFRRTSSSQSAQAPNSAESDTDSPAAPSPQIRKTRPMSSLGRRSISTGADNEQRMTGWSYRPAMTRPGTSESFDFKRRRGSGIFAWMRTGSRDGQSGQEEKATLGQKGSGSGLETLGNEDARGYQPELTVSSHTMIYAASKDEDGRWQTDRGVHESQRVARKLGK